MQKHAPTYSAGEQGVSWIDVVPFWWLGASGLGSRFVAKPVTFSYAKAV
jgi:hypothetical protein